MKIIQQTLALMYKDWRLEFRSKYAISSIVLYVFATVVLVYSALGDIQPQVWNALYWVIVLFAAVSAVVKSFVQESSARQLYYYSLLDPTALLLSKLIYNTILLLLLSLLTWLLLAVFTENLVKETGLFMLTLFLGSFGLSIAFTFASAIASKAGNNATLLAIMGFPIIIPILLTLLKLSANALRLFTDTSIDGDIMILVGIDLILLSVAFVLYPFLWRE